MGHRFAEIAFTPSVREVQRELGSRAAYAPLDEPGERYDDRLGETEAAFIRARDSFYMASMGETGWPYLQHRGGPAGFVRVLDERTLGFADFGGNRQYVSVGNLRGDDRVALFFMDYPGRTRLKVLGRAQLVGLDDPRMAELEVADYRARVERGFLIRIEAFDWNCPQHITPRYTEAQMRELIAPVIEENRALKARHGTAPAATARAIGSGPLELVVTGLRQLTPRIRAFELRAPQGGDLPPVEAGAHLQVPVALGDGGGVVRQYSLCSDPAQRERYEIAVLREDEGSGGSRAVHESFALGLHLRCGLPLNHFPLHADSRPAVLVAGGIGITPIKAMAHALRARCAPMRLHYAVRSGREAAFRDGLAGMLGSDLAVYRSDAGERLDLAAIFSTAPAEAVFYVCGPERLIDAARRCAAAANIEADRVRIERFLS